MRAKIPTYSYKNLKNNLGFEIQSLDFFARNTKSSQVEIHHRIDFYAILFITQGTGQHIIDFETYNYEPGSIFFMAKNQVVAYRINKKNRGVSFIF